MRSRTIQFCISVLLVVLFSQNIFSGQKVRYQFDNGKIYKYSSVVESQVSGQAMGQEFSMKSSAFVDYAISNAVLKENVYTLTTTFEKFDIKVNFPMMGFNDSTISLKEYVGKRVKITVTDLGKTLSVEPIDTVQPSRIQAMASMTPSDLFKHILLQLPDKELDLNGTWKNDTPDTTARGGMKMVSKQNIEMKIASEEKKFDLNCWKINMNGVNTIEGSGSQRGSDVTIDGSTKINGVAYIAPNDGIFVSSESSIETDMTTTVTGSETGASTMTVNATMKTTLVK